MAPHHQRRLRSLSAQVCAAPGRFAETDSWRSRERFAGPTQLDGSGQPTALRNEGQVHENPPVDPAQVEANADSILARYDAERDKRVEGAKRVGGTAQYKRIAELAKTDPKFARMISDPYIEEDGSQARVAVPALSDEVKIAIVGGAGFGGLSAGARLRQAGFEPKDIRIVDRAGDVAGTWYWNRYPGAMCDVEAPIYMPLCEEIGTLPTERYCKQPEMISHSRRIANFYGLYDNALWGRSVSDLRWDEQASRWVIETDRGDRFRAHYVLANFGTFTHPKLPHSPGIEDFAGHMWHTSRWDYGYTGGSSKGNLTNLQDKVVGIIGTGATSIQATPHLGQWAKHLYVFQRTPSAVDVRNNHLIPKDGSFFRENMSTPGWQAERVKNFTILLEGSLGRMRAEEDSIKDGWTSSTAILKRKLKEGFDPATFERKKTLAMLEHMEGIRARVDVVVKDPGTAEVLKPWYNLLCKRPTFHDEYLPTFNRPNVTLVDCSRGGGVEMFTKKGVVVGGKEYELDCICLATGFENSYLVASAFGDTEAIHRAGSMTTANGYDIVGKGGLRLSEKWATGPRTLTSYNVHGFPNLWIMNGPQGVLSTSFVTSLDVCATHAAYMIAQMEAKGQKSVEPKKAAEDAYCDMIYNDSDQSINFAGLDQNFYKNCTPGYYNSEGNMSVGKTLMSAFGGGQPGSVTRFFDFLAKKREEGKAFDDYDVE